MLRTRDRSWPLLLHVVSLAYGLFFLICHPVVHFRLNGSDSLDLWQDSLFHRLRWPLVVVGLVLTVWTLVLNISLRRRIDRTPSIMLATSEFWMTRTWPVAFLPVAGILLLLGDVTPVGVSAQAILFVPVLVISLMLMTWVENFLDQPSRFKGHEWSGLIFVASALIYASLGLTLAHVTGEHVGDEGHYLIQAKSLHQDHDLDIKNNFLKQEGVYEHDYEPGSDRLPKDESALLSYIHVSGRSLNGHWYSTHPYGLSVLLAPTMLPGWVGLILRYLLLGAISGLGNVGMYKLSREVGASRNAALITVAGFGLSIFWCIYSARALPEVLGATLLIWLFWSVWVQERRPWWAVLLGALCVVYLPITHDRFTAPALMGFGFFGLFGLFGNERWGAKLWRLTVFTALCAAGLTAYSMFQKHLFMGGMKYDMSGSFWHEMFNYPLGLWGVIADWRGVVPVLPSFMWLVGAWFAWWVTVGFVPGARGVRLACFACALAVTFVVALLASCCNGYYTAGKCLPGRYALVAIPLFIPGAAVMFERGSKSCRWWYLFLSVLSTMFLVLVLIWLPQIGRDFIFPVASLRTLHPMMDGLFNPHVNFLYPYPGVGPLQYWATAYVLAGMALTLVALFSERWRLVGPILFGIVAMVGLASHEIQMTPATTMDGGTRAIDGEDGQLAQYLSGVSMQSVCVKGHVSGDRELFDFAHLTFPDFRLTRQKIGITTDKLGERTVANLVSQPLLEANDWAGRGYGWTTLTAPHRPSAGGHILHVRGKVEGKAVPYLAIREGPTMLFERALPVVDGVVDQYVPFTCQGWRAHLYLLMRLGDGKGTIHLEKLEWMPFHPSMIHDTGLHLPSNVIGAN